MFGNFPSHPTFTKRTREHGLIPNGIMAPSSQQPSFLLSKERKQKIAKQKEHRSRTYALQWESLA